MTSAVFSASLLTPLSRKTDFSETIRECRWASLPQPARGFNPAVGRQGLRRPILLHAIPHTAFSYIRDPITDQRAASDHTESMKLVVQIAAGIVLGAFCLWVFGMAITAGALHSLASSLPLLAATPSPRAPTPSPAQPYSQAQLDQWNAETDAEAAREDAQAARCIVHTADGRTLFCDPLGPFTPR